jgi:hypothetical protein
MSTATTPPRLPVVRSVSFVQSSTWIVAALLAVSSVAGLIYGRLGWYDAGATMFPALIGQDAVALLLGLPLLVGSAALARRGSTRGLLCWMGALFYVAYFWYFYVVGIRFTPLLPVYIVLVSMGMYGALYLFFSLDLNDVRAHFDARTPTRLIGGFLMAVAVAFGGLWLMLIGASVVAGSELDSVTRLVVAIDGVVLLPLTFFGGYWLWRLQPLGFALAGLLLVKIVATFLTLVVTTAFSLRWGQAVDGLQTAAYTAGLIVGVVLLVVYLRHVHDDSRDIVTPLWPDSTNALAPRGGRMLDVFSLVAGSSRTQAGRQAAARARR